MKRVKHDMMGRQAAATLRIVMMALLLADSMRHATALERSPPPPGILINIEQPMYAGRSYEVVCSFVGWEVEPRMDWYLEDQLQLNAIQQILTSEERNESVSILKLTPSPEDNGKSLKCHTEDPIGIEETSVNLLVYYPPIIYLYVEPPQQADEIREGENVALTCHVQASPPVWRVKWIFQGRVLQQTNSSGPLNESLTLHLKSINRRQTGNYSCLVSNAMDDAESAPLQLTVNYIPVCTLEHPIIYTAKLGALLELECGGQGVPPVDTYRWMFSRAAYSDSQPTQFRIHAPNGEKITFLEWANGVSWRTYRLHTIFDYGTFYCNARNALGLQRESCAFHIVPPGKPSSPANCSVLNMTSVSFDVNCESTSEEGFRKRYVLEVFDAYTGQVKFNETQKEPNFQVHGLEPNLATTMRLAAFSHTGRSEWVRMNAVTLAQPTTTTTTSSTTTAEGPVAEEFME